MTAPESVGQAVASRPTVLNTPHGTPTRFRLGCHQTCCRRAFNQYESKRRREKRAADNPRILPPESAKEIPGREGYFATPDGEVYTTWAGRWKRSALKLHQHPNHGGYPTVRIKGRMLTVHQLVALTFIGPPPAGQQVRHLDGNRQNPRLENLRYGTAQENAQDRERHGNTPRNERAATAKFSDAQVAWAIDLYLSGAANQPQIAAMLGAHQTSVSLWIKHRAARNRTQEHSTTVRGVPG